MAKCAVVSPHYCAKSHPVPRLFNPYPYNQNGLKRLSFSFSFSPININSLHHHHQQIILHRRHRKAKVNAKANNLELQQWDSLTANFSGAANLPFLLLQLPQIILNARNLLAGNKSALLAVPWLGMLTGLLGNLSLLSYFAKKREKEATVVQTLGVLSQYIVFAQLAMAEAMPLPYFAITSVVVATGLLVNFLNYFYLLSSPIWRFWEDFITIGGLSALPQVSNI